VPAEWSTIWFGRAERQQDDFPWQPEAPQAARGQHLPPKRHLKRRALDALSCLARALPERCGAQASLGCVDELASCQVVAVEESHARMVGGGAPAQPE
jgi:hypothetical protein